MSSHCAIEEYFPDSARQSLSLLKASGYAYQNHCPSEIGNPCRMAIKYRAGYDVQQGGAVPYYNGAYFQEIMDISTFLRKRGDQISIDYSLGHLQMVTFFIVPDTRAGASGHRCECQNFSNTMT